ncbi:unnamed protein product [Rangifer tarandus platyrhynchus]|uniref:Uncharacterized protein n=1 Tax=Rangifer tarandus platyrhynchus TaxID=3082113 RepID=A0ABN8ZWE9_RANTA|nr:unnamed protein product [Rangifer tarandus platyrhynchus]
MPVLLILESGLEKPTCLHPNLAPRAFEPKLQELLRVPWVLPSRLLTATCERRSRAGPLPLRTLALGSHPQALAPRAFRPLAQQEIQAGPAPAGLRGLRAPAQRRGLHRLRAPVWTLLTSGELTVTPRGPRAECRALRPAPCSQACPSDWGLRGAPRMGAPALNGHWGREDPAGPPWPPCSPQLVLPSKAMSSCPELPGGGEDTVPPDIPLETPHDRQCPDQTLQDVAKSRPRSQRGGPRPLTCRRGMARYRVPSGKASLVLRVAAAGNVLFELGTLPVAEPGALTVVARTAIQPSSKPATQEQPCAQGRRCHLDDEK